MSDEDAEREADLQKWAVARAIFGDDCGLNYADARWWSGGRVDRALLVSDVVNHVVLTVASGRSASLMAFVGRVEQVVTCGTGDEQLLVDLVLEALAFRLTWFDGGLLAPAAVAIMDVFGPQARRNIYEYAM